MLLHPKWQFWICDNSFATIFTAEFRSNSFWLPLREIYWLIFFLMKVHTRHTAGPHPVSALFLYLPSPCIHLFHVYAFVLYPSSHSIRPLPVSIELPLLYPYPSYSVGPDPFSSRGARLMLLFHLTSPWHGNCLHFHFCWVILFALLSWINSLRIGFQ